MNSQDLMSCCSLVSDAGATGSQVQAGSLDLAWELAHQKLQMVDLCIRRRNERVGIQLVAPACSSLRASCLGL